VHCALFLQSKGLHCALFLQSKGVHFALLLHSKGVHYSGRGMFMPLPLKSKILETPGFLVTDYIKCFHYEFGR
jgi:hypothetical protein